MTAAAVAEKVEKTPVRVVGSFVCRRCAKAIDGADEVANLVARRPSDPGRSQFLIVCGGCVRPQERGYVGDVGPGDMPVALIHLPGALRTALNLVTQGVVYRVPHQILVLGGDAPAKNDMQITHSGYRLLQYKLIAWQPVPRKPATTGPTAWAELTERGREWLRLEAAGELETGGYEDDEDA